MSLFDRDQIQEDENEAGIHMRALGSALVTWAAMNYGNPTTVATAALAFNTTPEIIREAIDSSMWISYSDLDDDPAKQLIDCNYSIPRNLRRPSIT